MKNPIFQNALEVKNNRIVIRSIEGVLYDSIKEDTMAGLIEGKFSNDQEIKESLKVCSMPILFRDLKVKVSEYYESN